MPARIEESGKIRVCCLSVPRCANELGSNSGSKLCAVRSSVAPSRRMNLAAVRVGPQAPKSNLIDGRQHSAKPSHMGGRFFKILIVSVAWATLVAGLFRYLGQWESDASVSSAFWALPPWPLSSWEWCYGGRFGASNRNARPVAPTAVTHPFASLKITLQLLPRCLRTNVGELQLRCCGALRCGA